MHVLSFGPFRVRGLFKWCIPYAVCRVPVHRVENIWFSNKKITRNCIECVDSVCVWRFWCTSAYPTSIGTCRYCWNDFYSKWFDSVSVYITITTALSLSLSVLVQCEAPARLLWTYECVASHVWTKFIWIFYIFVFVGAASIDYFRWYYRASIDDDCIWMHSSYTRESQVGRDYT